MDGKKLRRINQEVHIDCIHRLKAIQGITGCFNQSEAIENAVDIAYEKLINDKNIHIRPGIINGKRN